VVAHELGHHTVRSTRYGLACAWLSWPWRAFASLALAFRATGRRQLRGSVAVCALGVAVAVVHAARAHQWSVATVLTAAALSLTDCPALNAGLQRRCDFAGDAFAAAHGYSRGLASALVLHSPANGTYSLWKRTTAEHPKLTRRLRTLDQYQEGEHQHPEHRQRVLIASPT